MAKLRSAKIFKQPFSTMNKNKPFKKKKNKNNQKIACSIHNQQEEKKNEEQKWADTERPLSGNMPWIEHGYKFYKQKWIIICNMIGIHCKIVSGYHSFSSHFIQFLMQGSSTDAFRIVFSTREYVFISRNLKQSEKVDRKWAS